MKHIQANKSNIKRLETQTSEIVFTIKNAREQVNKLFDVIEKDVEQKARQIYKEESIKCIDQVHQCQSLLAAVQDSRQLLDAILRLGNETQVFLTAQQIKTNLTNYREEIMKYVDLESMEISLTLNSNLKTLMSLAADQLAIVQTKVNVVRLSLDGIFRTPTLDSVIGIKYPNGGFTTCYGGSVWLPIGSILLSDYSNNKCCLYSSEHTHLSNYTIKRPWDVCFVGEDEVAVTSTDNNKIQFLTWTAPITPTRSFTTRYYCDGIAALSDDKLVISGYNNPGNQNYYWSILTTEGKEEYYHEIDQKGGSYTYLAVNESKTRLYMSCFHTNSVHCFGLDGQLHSVYKSENLIRPMGIGVDRDDNVYVAGYRSNNIHQLLPDGNLIQIIKTGIHARPWKLTFNKSGNRFLLTNDSDMRKTCQIFVLK